EERRERERLWGAAHAALSAEDFRAADTLFARFSERFPETPEGRDALFYLGALRMDPRNPAWSSRIAAEWLRQYLARGDTAGETRVHRRPEATTLLELANQLNMPAENRIAALKPDTVVTTRTRTVPRRVAPIEESHALSGEVERLRREIAERDETIRNQREELNRIRRTLAPGRRP
ncbi:MAG: hypothetical protein M3P24_05790, partial [Gemmatimonadota bacterium]|nr:hypothetical protein [Gemmatimonadota bacterium]